MSVYTHAHQHIDAEKYTLLYVNIPIVIQTQYSDQNKQRLQLRKIWDYCKLGI